MWGTVTLTPMFSLKPAVFPASSHRPQPPRLLRPAPTRLRLPPPTPTFTKTPSSTPHQHGNLHPHRHADFHGYALRLSRKTPVPPRETPTPSPTPYTADIFYVSKNLFTPANPVSIFVNYTSYPGPYALWIYNTAGEHVKTLADRQLSAPVSESYLWDGTNKYNAPCASGVYILYLVEPFSQKMKRIVLIK